MVHQIGQGYCCTSTDAKVGEDEDTVVATLVGVNKGTCRGQFGVQICLHRVFYRNLLQKRAFFFESKRCSLTKKGKYT